MDLLKQLNRDHKFQPTTIAQGRIWRWASATGKALTVNLPATVSVTFSEDGKFAWLSHDNGYFTADYAALLLDSAAAINANAPLPGAKNGIPAVVFKVVQTPGNAPPSKKH